MSPVFRLEGVSRVAEFGLVAHQVSHPLNYDVETTFDIVAAGGSEVGLTRDQTLMQGAPSCTFRYRFAPRS